MAKKLSIKNETKAKEKTKTVQKRRNLQKSSISIKGATPRKSPPSKKTRSKNRKISISNSLASSEKELKNIVLPRELLEIAKSKIDKKSSITSLKKAMKIYDIDDNINYEYLCKYKKISTVNFKYLYTLSYKNRKKILKKYNIKGKNLTQRAKITLYQLVNFLIHKYEANKERIKKQLNKFELQCFDTFIIQISEGDDELKYYYFIYVILKWLKDDDQAIKAKTFLTYFQNFFKEKSNLDKIKVLYYIILRLDLMFFNEIEDRSILQKIQYSIDETIEEKFQKLQLIKDKIKENIDLIEITEETELTLKSPKIKFKPIDYIFGTYSNVEGLQIINNIIYKKDMSYNYYNMNRLNYFGDDDTKKNAFISIVNITLSSNVIKEYFKKVEAFQDYEFPFRNENSDILNYLWNKVMYTDLDQYTWGITNREGFGIFINRDKGKNSNGLGYGANLITTDHEFIGHLIKYIINSNNKIKAGTATPNESFINEEDNIKSEKYSDGGDKFEVLLFGQRLNHLTLGGNHFLFNINNWSLPLSQFQNGFKKNNIKKSLSSLQNELDNIKKNSLVKALFKDIDYNNMDNKKICHSLSLKSNKSLNTQELDMKGFR